MTATAAATDRLSELRAKTEALNAINVAQILGDRYAAAKSGPEVTARVKKTNTPVRQQKWKIGDGHHINVCDTNGWYDLLERHGGVGAVALVMHLERLEFKEAKALLSGWYPNYATFKGTAVKRAAVAVVPEPAPPRRLVLPKFRHSTHENPRERRDYLAVVERYLVRERGLPPELVRQAMEANKAYPTEKTSALIERTPAGEKLAEELAALCETNNWQYSSRTEAYDGAPITARVEGKAVPAIRFRSESRPEIKARLTNPPAYEVGGGKGAEKPRVVGLRVQVELAHPIQRFFTEEPIATSIRSLEGTHKQCVGPKTQGAIILGELAPHTQRLVLTESGIEALSYVALKGQHAEECVLGLSGSGNIDELFPFLKQQAVTLVNAFNNEAAGRKFAEKVRARAVEHGVECQDEFPPGGEISIEADDDEENRKYFEHLRTTARENRVRFVEKAIPSKDGKKPARYRMRIESHAEAWKLLGTPDPAEVRKAREAERAGQRSEGLMHFRETAVIEPICKDWNDVLRGDSRRVFTTDFARKFDRNHDYMTPASLAPAETPAEKKVEREGAGRSDGPEIG